MILNIFFRLCVLLILPLALFYSLSSFAATIKMTNGFLTTYKLGKFIDDVYTDDQAILIHTYRSNNGVNTHIIETYKSLVIIDVQSNLRDADEVYYYAKKLNKTIEAVIITNSLSSNYMGLSIFKNHPTYASNSTISQISKKSAKLIKYIKDNNISNMPINVVLPANKLNSNFKIDGVKYETISYPDTYNEDSTVILLKDYKLVIASNLILLNRHLVIYNYVKYEEALQDFKKIAAGYIDLLNSHEEMVNVNKALDNTLVYLSKAKRVLGREDKADSYINEMQKLYPSYLTNKTNEETQRRILKSKYGKY